MRLRCENCQTEYSVADAPSGTAGRAHCPRCKHVQAVIGQGPTQGLPLTTPTGKSQIGRVNLTTRTIHKIEEKASGGLDEEELFGELEWETDSTLEYVVGRTHPPLEGTPPVPTVPPVAPKPATQPLGQSSVPIDWSEVSEEYDAAVAKEAQEKLHPRTDEWPEDEVSDPWRKTPLPALGAPIGPARPAIVPPPAAPPPPVAPRPPVLSTPTPVPAAPRTPAKGIPLGTPRPGPGPATAAARTEEPCAACGGRLLDADDRASGVCGPCRARAAAALGRGPSAATEATPPAPSGAPAGPTTPRIRRVLTAEIPKSKPRLVILLALLVLSGVVAAVLVYLRTRSERLVLPDVSRLRVPGTGKPGQPQPLPDGLEARIEEWKASIPAGTVVPPDVIPVARANIAADTVASDSAAEKSLRAALVQEPRHAEALGLWLEAVARARGQALSRSALNDLITLGESAVERMGRRPPLLLGLAALLGSRGREADLQLARRLAQQAVDAYQPARPDGGPAPAALAPPWAGSARMALAETYVTSSGALALSLLDDAEHLDPALRHVWNVRAAVQASGGNPRAALVALQARLKLDPDHPATLRAQAAVYAQVGEVAQARKIYDRLQADRRTQDGPAVVDMAELRAGPERAPAEAVRLLSGAIARSTLSGNDLIDAQIRLARIARAANDLPTAVSAAAAAVRLAPDDSLAHAQALLVDLDRGAPGPAAAHLPRILGQLDNPGLAALLEGRVRAAEQQWQSAAEAFERAVEADPRRTDARLWAAAAWATAGQRDRALQIVAPALEADPFRPGPGMPPLWPGDGLKGANERLALLSKEDRDGLPLLAEAVVRFHQGDPAAAEGLVTRVLKAGGNQALVLGWKSILLGARGDAAGALVAAREAVAQGRASGFAQFALGSALLATGDLDGARKALREAHTLLPALLTAEVRQAEIEARTGGVAAARDRLQRVIALDPEYASARRALYLLPPEG
jgi:cellulose synthase operon protein C